MSLEKEYKGTIPLTGKKGGKEKSDVQKGQSQFRKLRKKQRD